MIEVLAVANLRTLNTPLLRQRFLQQVRSKVLATTKQRWWCRSLTDEQYEAAKATMNDAPPLSDASFTALRVIITASGGLPR